MNIDQLLANWIRDARKAAGISGEQLAAKMALELGTEKGNTKATVSHWENLRHQPSIQQLLTIAKITRQPLPDEITQYLSAPPRFQGEVPVERETVVTVIARNTLEEMELLGLYRLSTESGKRLIMDAANNSDKEPVAIRAVS